MNLIMKEMPLAERPYEKFDKYGPEALSDADLLAVIIRTGCRNMPSTELAKQILANFPEKRLDGLFSVSMEELQEIPGVGRVKSIQLLCIAELTKRIMMSRVSPCELICDSPKKVASYFIPAMRFLETEEVRLLILDGKGAMKRDIVISNGSFNSSLASPREIFYNALKNKAVSIILLHNHPSGSPSPSREDVELTKRIYDTGKLIGINLIDHIIIGGDSYESFKENGYF